jgi:cytidylate kinase
MPACGKTTVAKAIADRFGLKLYGGGDALKEIARKRGYEVKGDDWWDKEEGMRFLMERKKDNRFDREVDEFLLNKLKEGGVIVTSYPLPWLAKDPIKIWLSASLENRAERMAKRDGISIDEAVNVVKKRDDENKALYKALYGIKFGEDLSVFDFVINTNILTTNGVIEVVCKIVEQLIKGELNEQS